MAKSDPQLEANLVAAQIVSSAAPTIPVAEEIVETPDVVETSDIVLDPEIITNVTAERSWPFLIVDWFLVASRRLFGFCSLIFLLAFIACIPVVQILSFGYLMESKSRIAKTGKFWSGLFGLDKASRVGSIVLGTWLLLWPIRILSTLWYEAQLIDPASSQSAFLRVAQIVVAILIGAHILAAWFCGGKLRYFFWPLVAPFSLAVWTARKLAGSEAFRPALDAAVGWISPNLVNDLCNAKNITDWFLPAILWKNLISGTLFTRARDGVWDFANSLNLKHYFWLGFQGLVGSAIWLFGPTVFLIGASMLENFAAFICGLIGVGMSTIVYVLLPFLQAHFANEKRFSCFFEIGPVYQAFRRTPIHHWLALLTTFVLALPLFLLKIERIPTELMWTLSLVFVVFTLPAHMVVGWAFGRAQFRPQKSWRLVSYPVIVLFAPAISFAFTFIFFFTRYTSWNGAWSLFEHHAFLLPAPFWLF